MIEREIENVLRSVYFKITVKGRTALNEIKITPPQFRLMTHVYFNGPMNQTTLSKDLFLAKSTISGIVERLRKRRFVKMAKREKDLRNEIVMLTPAGEEVIKRVIDKRVDYIHKLLYDFTEEDKEKLLELLIQMDETSKKLE